MFPERRFTQFHAATTAGATEPPPPPKRQVARAPAPENPALVDADAAE